MIDIRNGNTRLEVITFDYVKWTVTAIIDGETTEKTFEGIKDTWCYVEKFREYFDMNEWEYFLDELFLESKQKVLD